MAAPSLDALWTRWYGLTPCCDVRGGAGQGPDARHASRSARAASSACSSAADSDDEGALFDVPSALAVVATNAAIASPWRPVRYAAAGPPPSPGDGGGGHAAAGWGLAPALASLVAPGAAAAYDNAGRGSPRGRAPSPAPEGGGGDGGRADEAAPCSKVAVPLGRAALRSVRRQESFSAPTPAGDGNPLADASPDSGGAGAGGAGVAAAVDGGGRRLPGRRSLSDVAAHVMAARAGAAAPAAAAEPAAPGGQQTRAAARAIDQPPVGWISAFPFAIGAATPAAAPPAPEPAPTPAPAPARPQGREAGAPGPATLVGRPGPGSEAAAGAGAAGVPRVEGFAEGGTPSRPLGAGPAAAAHPPFELAEAAEPAGAAKQRSGAAAAGAGEGLAWRFRFANKWRRARRVDPLQQFEADSPDPLAFITAHGAAAAETLAANAPSARPGSGGGAAAAAAAPRGGGASAGSCAGSATLGGAGSLVLPRVFSGGEMHQQLVAEATLARDALVQAQQAAAAAQAAAPSPPAGSPAGGADCGAARLAAWVGPLLPAVSVDLPTVSHEAFILVRVTDARAPGAAAAAAAGAAAGSGSPLSAAAGRARLVLRAAPRGARARGAALDKQLLAGLASEAAALAAASRLSPSGRHGLRFEIVGRGRLLKAGAHAVKAVGAPAAAAGARAAPAGALAPGAAVGLAAALLRLSAPPGWRVLE
ncbi:hypothetical protein Rsub_06632 [Raphidocelis subcapitata]|uniref:Uncharacterized protein n=1 Tax=Raphidocelis subcapitata TaxID=307507 RepID=A0A2V0P1Q6_9CHLO|nr:hypothetical protein Rsub_06632 [Raphidocelis subcapitata]|eukprot:GBF93499.1 hypothetical protein Rsub_06632 [Raphidocelis subcapitata]